MSLFTVPLLINGAAVATSPSFPVPNPATGAPLWNCTCATLDDAAAAISAASAAFKTWKTTSTTTRRDYILKIADALEAAAAEITEVMVVETASAPDWCAFNIGTAVAMLRGVAARVCSGVLDGKIPESAVPGLTAMMTKVPFGVVLGIAPWNAPIILSVRAILYPLAAGNTVIFKSSELSPRTHYLIARLFSSILPPGVVNLLSHSRDAAAAITEALIASPAVRKVNFTGSTPTGRIIAAMAGRHLTPCTLELGGKAPMIICADADLPAAATAAAFGAMHHAGQICMSTERVLVHASVATEFTALLKAKVAAMYGDSQVMIQPAAALRVAALTDSKALHAAHPNRVLTDVPTSDALWRTESFGPVVLVNTFTDEAAAVDAANDCEFGLSAAVWTRDLARGLRLAGEIESGAVHVNGATVHDEVALPHGGVKNSGWGRFGENGGIAEFCWVKTVTFRS
ncbi:Aldehyde/histidinol dehydrogenase [Geopyxis carbonaria]|nr:Aldehyde/histidinol dehydrogenase [Geopyxis carbonaria]